VRKKSRKKADEEARKKRIEEVKFRQDIADNSCVRGYVSDQEYVMKNESEGEYFERFEREDEWEA
jgi:hypothetical protein